jgi:uncharacterized protein
MESTHLIGNTFVVKNNDSYIVYSPFNGKIARVPFFPKEGSNIFLHLSQAGFFGSLPTSIQRDSINTWCGFRSLTLLVTRKCNLSCIYCYATARTTGRSMDQELALNSLDWFTKQFTGDTIRVTFHGGGEPTLELKLIQEVVKRSLYIANRDNKKTRFVIVTNGTGDENITEWLMKNNFSISISADGPPHIQNRNRPFANGEGSSDAVELTIRYLVKRNYSFTIRLTFSPVDDLKEIIEYFGNLGVKSLHIEPLFPFGRYYNKVSFGKKSQMDIYSPGGNEFVASFLEGMDTARKFGIKITNSHLGHLTKGLGYFCGSASGKSMIVTDDGFITGCLEVVDAQDPDFETFRLGEFSPRLKTFIINKPILDKFQNRHSDVLPCCKKCFARYVCSGGCAVKAVRASKNFMERDLPYCVFTKELIPAVIGRIANLSKI